VKLKREGKLPQERLMEGECSNCKCAIECKQGEAEHTSDQRDGDFYSIKCPTNGCGRTIYLKHI
jgi:hypothetical protein